MDSPWVIVDVETTGIDPATHRIISIAALTLTTAGAIEQTFSTLLDADADPGPTAIHGLTADMLAGQPQFADIANELTTILTGRILVAHNAAFDYAFLAAEAARTQTTLPLDTALCTVELAAALPIATTNNQLGTLATHFGITQENPTTHSTTHAS